MGGRRRIKSGPIAIILTFALLFSLTPREAAAPPFGGSCYSGILTSVGSEVAIVRADINMTVSTHRSFDGFFVHEIELNGRYNLTNKAAENAAILLLYLPSWHTSSGYLNCSDYKTFVEGNPLSLVNSTFANTTHPRELPLEFHSRFPDWVFASDEYWYNPATFIMTNLSLAPFTSLLFHFSDSIVVTSRGTDFSVVGYAFSSDQISADSTRINVRIRVPDGSQFVGVSFNPDDTVGSTQEGSEYIGQWSVSSPYSPLLMTGYGPTALRAGFQAYLKDYLNVYPPTIPYTTSENTSIPTTYSPDTIPSLGIVLVIACVIVSTLVVYIHARRT